MGQWYTGSKKTDGHAVISHIRANLLKMLKSKLTLIAIKYQPRIKFFSSKQKTITL